MSSGIAFFGLHVTQYQYSLSSCRIISKDVLYDLLVQTSTSLLNLLQLLIHTLYGNRNTKCNTSCVRVLRVDARREEVVGLQLDETAVHRAFREHGGCGLEGGEVADLPAEDSGVESFDALEVGARDFSPGDHLVIVSGKVSEGKGRRTPGSIGLELVSVSAIACKLFGVVELS
jgi:hypothetical protein